MYVSKSKFIIILLYIINREYNSALPSSAACERLFSAAGLIFVPKRSNLSDNNFDKLVFLKQNGTSSRNWQSFPSTTSFKK